MQVCNSPESITFIDLFSGIGGFRFAAQQSASKLGLKTECVFSSDIDEEARSAYKANFGDFPAGDITLVDERDIPDHEVLFAGFPCQAFSIIGMGKGFDDTRGTLFFDIARILNEKNPKAFVLENVKQLRGHDGGRTFDIIMSTLNDLGYSVEAKVLNALDYGLPQKRERVLIVGFKKELKIEFKWPEPVGKQVSLDDILENDEVVDPKHFASEMILQRRQEQVAGKEIPPGRSIWHENKSGNVSPLPYSCALRAGASYNYLLVDGKRRLTPREMLRIQGFPETFVIACTDSATRKQAGNSVPVPMIQAVVQQTFSALIEKV